MSGMPSLGVTCKDQRGREYRLPSTLLCSLPWRDGIWPNTLVGEWTLGWDKEDKKAKGRWEGITKGWEEQGLGAGENLQTKTGRQADTDWFGGHLPLYLRLGRQKDVPD